MRRKGNHPLNRVRLFLRTCLTAEQQNGCQKQVKEKSGHKLFLIVFKGDCAGNHAHGMRFKQVTVKIVNAQFTVLLKIFAV